MVVLILVLVWAVALLPIALKKRSERELSSSITKFRQGRRALVELSAAAPSSVDRTADRRGDRDVGANGTPARHHRDEKLARARLKAQVARRRRTLTVLGGTILGTVVLGAIPALRPLWDLTIVAGLATVAYLGALVYFRRLEVLAAERQRKVVELAARARRSGVVPVPRRPAFVIVEATS